MHKEHAFRICKMHMNRPVRVQTRSGHLYEGTIVNVDENFVYLRVGRGYAGSPGDTRGFFYPPGYYSPSDQILTLALFDLLAITLLLL